MKLPFHISTNVGFFSAVCVMKIESSRNVPRRRGFNAILSMLCYSAQTHEELLVIDQALDTELENH